MVLFPLRGWADAKAVERYPHHWANLGQFGRFVRIARKEGCRDVIFIGSLVRPAITQLSAFDWETLRLLPRVVRQFYGGDDHLLSGVARIFEDYGFRMLGAHEVAPEILMPEGALGGLRPKARDYSDIARGLAALRAIGPFDVGQAVVVANNHVLALEAAEGTDQMLARIAELRRPGAFASRDGIGVLVKAPKPGQDRRFDLPSIGPRTIEGAARRGPCRHRGDRRRRDCRRAASVVIRAADRAGIVRRRRGGELRNMKVFHRRRRGIRRPARRRADARAESDRTARTSNSAASAAMTWRRKGCRRCSASTSLPSSASPPFRAGCRRSSSRIRQTARAAIAARPDVMVIIDSPDFTHRVARRVRRYNPSIPIVDYVSPSVWAWRPGRARAMRRYVDHVLALLPFEPGVHARLGGPPCTYVGHPLVEQVDELRPERGGGAPPQLPLPGLAGAAGQPQGARSSGCSSRSSARSSASPKRSGRSTSIIPTTPHLADVVHARNRRLAAAAQDRGQARGPARGVPASRARRSPNPARSRSSLRSRACRWSRPTGCRASKLAIARRLIRVPVA